MPRAALGMLPRLSLAGPSRTFSRPTCPHVYSLPPALLSYRPPAIMSGPVVTLSLTGPGFPPGTTPLGFPGRKGSPEPCFCLPPHSGLPRAWNLTGYCNIVAE